MSLSCYIIDDEPHSIEVLVKYVNQTPGLELSGTATNPLLAIEEFCNKPFPALIFLDVDMPQLNGLDVADLLGPESRIIFITSFREYAPEAFEKNAVDYLLKPINYLRFMKAVTKVRSNFPGQLPDNAASAYFFVKSNIKGQFNRITISNIRYIENIGNYIYIHTDKEKFATYLTLSEILSKLPEQNFSRIHQSFIINHSVIRSVEYAQVRLSEQLNLPIGGTFRAAFREKIQRNTIISKRERHID
ncbi:LytTR family DNA-binding domain-containing protein [Pedobacter sp. Leaf176]|uniref:LytR/AlgR family response regulator transcription factor n=1 Tax=Pedobacter sp. Leaf176 TaxID=1736286 RepID=UPI0006F84681|nr:LytTR family DNA-binding domain-containing protein [Pedobacter sp. Leaf176]KQR66939.1 hypothetical protein ASF92_19500 [Pedobacter sp. Leaf176]